MHKFDVRYSFDNYYEYYKFALIKQRILRDIIFSVLFVAIAIYWWVDGGEATEGHLLPIFAISMGVIFPLMNLFTLPMLKKQIKSKQAEIDRTHIVVTFDEEEIIYENQSEIPSQAKAEEKVEEVNKETTTEEAVEEKPVEEVKPQEDERVFKLKYANFMQVKETEGLFLFFLDRQTVIILPKTTYVGGEDYSEFKNFILSKINPKRVKFLKK